ncbi:MAG: hypothetical protein L6R40_000215 [Gallowayella cf. fulva]|nr:MAG: hypothetical protein L6R40_000215 [Xanthomendoza cf. fulva]
MRDEKYSGLCHSIFMDGWNITVEELEIEEEETDDILGLLKALPPKISRFVQEMPSTPSTVDVSPNWPEPNFPDFGFKPLPRPPVTDAVERGICMPPACTPLHPAQYGPTPVTAALSELDFNPLPTAARLLNLARRSTGTSTGGVSAESAHVNVPPMVGAESAHVNVTNIQPRSMSSNGPLSAENGRVGAPGHHIDGHVHNLPPVSAESAHVNVTNIIQPRSLSSHSPLSAENGNVGAPNHHHHGEYNPPMVSAESAHVNVTSIIQPRSLSSHGPSSSAENSRVGAPGYQITSAENGNVGAPHHHHHHGGECNDDSTTGQQSAENAHVCVPPA